MSRRFLLLSLLTAACVPTGSTISDAPVSLDDMALVHIFARSVSDLEDAVASEDETYAAPRRVVVYVARREFRPSTMPPSRERAFALADATACYRQESDGVEAHLAELEKLMKVPCDEVRQSRADVMLHADTRSVFVGVVDIGSRVWAGIDLVILPQDLLEDAPPRHIVYSGAWMLLSQSNAEWTVVNGCLPRTTVKALRAQAQVEEVHYCATLPLDIQAESAAEGKRFY